MIAESAFLRSTAQTNTSFYFEYAYPNPAERRAFLHPFVSHAEPSHGHLVLSVLMKLGKVAIVWTTNFDKLVEDAASRAFGTTTALTVAELAHAELAADAVADKPFLCLSSSTEIFTIGGSRTLRSSYALKMKSYEGFSLIPAIIEAWQSWGIAGATSQSWRPLKAPLKREGASTVDFTGYTVGKCNPSTSRTALEARPRARSPRGVGKDQWLRRALGRSLTPR